MVVSVWPIAFLFILVLLASLAGIRIAARLPWTEAARTALAPLTFGLALAPFIVGIAAVLVLTFLPGWPPATHLALVFGLLVLAIALTAIRPAAARPLPRAAPLLWGEWALAAAVAAAIAMLLFLSIFVPLTQNDSLEYMTVGRILFDVRSIGAYPVLDPSSNPGGFFGPWTHPPLYVALIYLFELIQGHADAPGIARLVAPWFAITASAVVYSLGRVVSRPVALGAALIFVTTPLLFLGAASALLDALPIAGFAMLLLVLQGIEARPAIRGAVVGVVVGLALWTHSATILFLPLALAGIVLVSGLANWRRWLAEGTSFLVLALLVGGTHYIRNVMLFGAPISDNPAVFALPGLFWDDYFLINRGLNSTVALIQYGLLKGWFALESFGLSYWGMAVGFVVAASIGGRPPLPRILWRGATSFEAWRALLYLVYGLLIVYAAGTAVSIVLGIDLMIKNERYLLSIQAAIAVGAAYGFVGVLTWATRWLGERDAFARSFGLAVLAAALAAQVAVFGLYVVTREGRPAAKVFEGLDAGLSALGDYQLTDFLRDETPADALVLSMKPADMYYTGRRMLGYLDPALLPFYGMTDPAAAAAELRRLGVSYVHVPSYGIPPIYNSALTPILRDPALAELLLSTTGGQIYALHPSGLVAGETIDLTPGRWPWIRGTVFELGGRKRLRQVQSSDSTALVGTVSDAEPPLGLFQRNVVTMLQSSGEGRFVPVRGGEELAVDVELSGTGLINVLVNEYREEGGSPRLIRSVSMGSFELSDRQPRRLYSRRTQVLAETDGISVVVEQQGQSNLELESVQVVRLSAN